MYGKLALTISLFAFCVLSYNILAQDLTSTNSDLANKSHAEDCADSSDIINSDPLASVDQLAEFPEGSSQLMKYVRMNLRYPAIASCDAPRIEGRIVVRFVVTKNGCIRDAQVVRSLDKYCDIEALRVVNSMPKWIPAKRNSKDVDSYVYLPMVFKLSE